MSKPARYCIRRVEIGAGARFGCAAGALAALPFGLIGGIMVRVLVGIVRSILEGWQAVPLNLGALGQPSLDMVALLNLNEWLARARFLDSAPVMVFASILLLTVAFVGAWGSLLGIVGAFVYNTIAALSGGLTIDLEAVE